MKRFNRILEQYVKENESLTRVRLKVDPKDRAGADFRDFDGYEGYILKEGKYFNVLIEGMDFPIMQVPFSVIKVVSIKDNDTFDRVKIAAIEKLNEIKDITPEFINKIGRCNSVDFFEQFLKEEGLSDFDLKDIYKKYIFADTLSEGVNWGNVGNSLKRAYQKTKKAANVGLGVLFPTFGAEQALKYLEGQVDPGKSDMGNSGSSLGSTQQITRYQNAINTMPAIPVASTSAPQVSAAISQNFKFDQIYNGYANSATFDIINITPVNNGLNLKLYNYRYINPNNLNLDPQVKTGLDDYFNRILPTEAPGAQKFNTQSVFEIAGAPLLPGSP